MWYNRRSLIKSAAILLTAMSQPLVGKFAQAKSTGVTMNVVTTFPKPLTQVEWDNIKESFVDPRFNELFLEMLSKGEIKSDRHLFKTTHAIWQVTFSDILASEKWINQVEELGLVKNALCRDQNYRIESYLS